MRTRTIATATAAVLAVGGAAAIAVPAHADGKDKKARGHIGNAAYELSVEKEHGYEVEADLDRVPAGSTWRLTVTHDGKLVSKQTHRAHRDDGRWDVDFNDLHRRNSAGKDVFVMSIKRLDAKGSAAHTFAFAR